MDLTQLPSVNSTAESLPSPKNENVDIFIGKEKKNFNEYLSVIEGNLCNIIEVIIKMALRDMYASKFYLVGGKAVNSILPKYLDKSFDFDIHLHRDVNVDSFKKEVINKTNMYMNEDHHKAFRVYIFRILLKLDIVSYDEFEHYIEKQLFYSGRRISSSSKIDNLFICLKLKSNIFERNGQKAAFLFDKNLNEAVIPIKSNQENYIYLPISDVDYEPLSNVGLGWSIDNSELKFTFKHEGILYSNFLLIVYNLICYIQSNICKFINEKKDFTQKKYFKKFNRNLKKLHLLTNTSRYSCRMISDKYKTQLNELISYLDQDSLFDNDNNDCDYLKSRCESIGNVPSKYIETRNENIRINSNKIFTSNKLIKEILKDFKNDFEKLYEGKKKICNINAILNSTNDLNINWTKNETYLKNTCDLQYTQNRFAQLLYKIDDKKIAKGYTQTYKSREINNYLINKSLGVLPSDNNQKIIDFENECKNLDKVYEDFHKLMLDPASHKDIKDCILDEFSVYSIMESYLLQDNLGSLVLDSINVGDILNIPSFCSTSYKNNYHTISFLKDRKIVLEIVINKNNTNYLILDKYSYFKSEAEILIKRGQYFVVLDNTFKSVINESNPDRKFTNEFQVLKLKLCNSENESIEYSKNLLLPNKITLTDHPEFKKAVQYVYNNFYSKQYNDALFEMNNGIYRPYHSLGNTLRKALLIPLFVAHFEKSKKVLDTNEFNSQSFTNSKLSQRDILKLAIVELFAVTGRQGEVSFGENPQKYTEYLKSSAENFKQYALTIKDPFAKFSLFEIEAYKNILINKGTPNVDYSGTALENGKINSKFAWILNCVHDLDLPRVGQYLNLDNLKLDKVFDNDTLSSFFKLAENLIIETGDRILVSKFSKQANRLPALFNRCNTDPEYCTSIINKNIYVSSLMSPDILDEIKVSWDTIPTPPSESSDIQVPNLTNDKVKDIINTLRKPLIEEKKLYKQNNDIVNTLKTKEAISSVLNVLKSGPPGPNESLLIDLLNDKLKQRIGDPSTSDPLLSETSTSSIIDNLQESVDIIGKQIDILSIDAFKDCDEKQIKSQPKDDDEIIDIIEDDDEIIDIIEDDDEFIDIIKDKEKLTGTTPDPKFKVGDNVTNDKGTIGKIKTIGFEEIKDSTGIKVYKPVYMVSYGNDIEIIENQEDLQLHINTPVRQMADISSDPKFKTGDTVINTENRIGKIQSVGFQETLDGLGNKVLIPFYMVLYGRDDLKKETETYLTLYNPEYEYLNKNKVQIKKLSIKPNSQPLTFQPQKQTFDPSTFDPSTFDPQTFNPQKQTIDLQTFDPLSFDPQKQTLQLQTLESPKVQPIVQPIVQSIVQPKSNTTKYTCNYKITMFVNKNVKINKNDNIIVNDSPMILMNVSRGNDFTNLKKTKDCENVDVTNYMNNLSVFMENYQKNSDTISKNKYLKYKLKYMKLKELQKK